MLAAVAPKNCAIPVLIRNPRHFRNMYRWPLLILLVGAFLDALTTYEFLRTFGPSVEVHPVQRLVFCLLPPLPGILLAKAGQVATTIIVAAWWQPWCKWLMLLTGTLYTVAAASNHFIWL
jgi:hypothetical protein